MHINTQYSKYKNLRFLEKKSEFLASEIPMTVFCVSDEICLPKIIPLFPLHLYLHGKRFLIDELRMPWWIRLLRILLLALRAKTC